MFVSIDDLSLIEQADLAMRIAREQMHTAVNTLLEVKGSGVAPAVIRFGNVHRTQGRIAAIKEARDSLGLDLLHAKCVIESLAYRYGAHFTNPVRTP